MLPLGSCEGPLSAACQAATQVAFENSVIMEGQTNDRNHRST